MQSFDLPQTLVDENLFLTILHRTPEERYALQSITLRTDKCWTRVVLPSVAFHAVGQSSILKGAQMISSACVNGDCDFEDVSVSLYKCSCLLILSRYWLLLIKR